MTRQFLRLFLPWALGAGAVAALLQTMQAQHAVALTTLALLLAGAFGALRQAQARVRQLTDGAASQRTGEDPHRRIIDTAMVGIWAIDRDHRTTLANPRMAEMLGYSAAELAGRRIEEFMFPEDLADQAEQMRRREQGESGRYQRRLRTRQGDAVWALVAATPLRTADGELDGSVAIVSDITDQKRAEEVAAGRVRLLDFAAGHDLHQLLVATLDEAGSLTGSPIGFYHFVGTDQRTLSLQAWSTRTTAEFCKAEGSGRHYDLDEAGVWADCVRQRRAIIHNDYPALPHRRGLPPGHAAIRREMVVPVLREGVIVALLGVGNKASDYTASDLDVVASLADLAWDIALRKRAEEALLESETRYRTLVANIPEAVYRRDVAAPWRVTVMSDGAEALTAHPAAAFLSRPDGLDWAKLILPDDLARVEREVAGAVAQHRPYVLEYRIIRADGSLRWVQETGRAVYDTTGRPLWLDGSIGDISALKEVESALRESERRLRDTLDNIDLIAIALDLDGRVEYCNDHFLRVTGCTRAEAIGADWFSRFLPDQIRDQVHELFLQAVRENRVPVHHENEIIARDGTHRLVRWTNTVMRDGRGLIAGSVSIGEDVTERHHADEAVRQLNDTLEQRVAERTVELSLALRELESFSYSISHDLRTPLRGIAGFSALLEDEYGAVLDAEGQDYLRRIRRGAQRMAQLIDDLLDLARIARHEMDRGPIDLGELALDVVARQRRRDPERPVQVEVQTGLHADADPELLRSLLEQLLDNAWKFSRPRAEARIEVGRIDDENGSAFFVRDNGVGFDMRYAGKLFRPFQRLHGATEFEGNGIGLAKVQRIVQRHGGRAWIEAVPDAGTTAYFTLGRRSSPQTPMRGG